MGTLILLRHGQSEWNKSNQFTGWVDVDLTKQGEQEAAAAGKMLCDEDFLPDVVHTSRQLRAIRTAQIALRAADRAWIPVRRSWRLNERHYGALQGLDKKATAEKYGEDQVKLWRRSFSVRPPALEGEALAEQQGAAQYADLPEDLLPTSECLADVIERMLPYWYDGILPDLEAGRTTLVAAHGNSLRGLVMHLDRLDEDAVLELNIPTGIPLVYELGPRYEPLSSRYLGDPDEVKAAADAVAKQAG